MKNNLLFTSVVAISLIANALTSNHVNAQGCVAVRYMAGGCSAGMDSSNNKWQFNVGYRYLHSYKHFKNDVEQHERTDLYNDQVVNVSNSVDITGSYAFTKKFSLAVSIPVSHTVRSSKYEHGFNSSNVVGSNIDPVTKLPYPKPIEPFDMDRGYTSSRGIGDIRIVANFRLTKPESHMEKDFVLGLGFKLPTGDYNVKDVFFRPVTPVKGYDPARKVTPVYAPVDQSIQLGDGGLGIITEFSAYKKLLHNLFLYSNGFYMFNPRNTNGVVAGLDVNKSMAPMTAYGVVPDMSVADQYMGRFGVSYSPGFIRNLSATIGPRIEGIPRWDIIGKSDGFRRPGYIVSVEPGVSYTAGINTFGFYVPYALYRNRIKNVADTRKPFPGNGLVTPSGFNDITTTGDAAFADYLIMINYSCRF